MMEATKLATCTIPAAVLVMLSGCATHIPMGTTEARLGQFAPVSGPDRREKLEQAMTDQDIAALLDVNVQAKWPSDVAIAKLAASGLGTPAMLAEIDAAEMAGWEKTAADHPNVKSVNPVTPLSHTSEHVTLRSLRLAAARMNCEVFLVYLQADSAVSNRNDASALYWTGVGLWLVPGHEVEHKTVLQAALIDCRTGMMFGTATGDSHIQRLCPWMFTDNRRTQLARQAPLEAVAELQTNTAKLLTRVAGTARVTTAP